MASELKLERSIEQWRNMNPATVLRGSQAQIMYALEDARKDILALGAALATPVAPVSPDEVKVSIPRNPSEVMMNAGLYHCSHDMEWSDLFTAWQAMYDAVTLDGGITEKAKASVSPDAADCPACGGTGQMGPFFPGGLSTICGNCHPAPDATGKCGELVTYRPSYTIERSDCGPVTKAIMEDHKDGKYVTRSQAEELLAERDTIIRSHLITIASLEAKLSAGRTTFRLEWLAGARPPMHPEPMAGRQSFSSFDEAIAFMKRQAPDAQFVALTERTIIQTDEDRSTEARAALLDAKEQGN